MNYESPEDRIEKLEQKVDLLVKATRNATTFVGSSHEALTATISIFTALENANLTLFRVLFDLPSVPASVREKFGKLLADAQRTLEEQKLAIQNLLNAMPKTVLPEDLFGPP